MSEPKRYICKVVNTCCDHMDACLSVKHSRKEAPEGEYVRWEEYARLEAEVERLTKAGEWQPIDTAPFDEYVLVWKEFNYKMPPYGAATRHVKTKYGSGHEWYPDLEEHTFTVTHWMPLPSAPAKEGKPQP